MAVLNESLPDEELACQALEGSLVSFEQLVQRYEKRIFSFLLLKIRNVHDVEDLTQNTFITAYRKLKQFDVNRKFSAWLFTIAGRLAIQHYRGARKGIEVSDDEIDKEKVNEIDPASVLSGAESSKDLWLHIKGVVSEDQYTALWLKYSGDFSIKDVARTMIKTELHVKVILHRARRKLEKNFRECVEEGRTVSDVDLVNRGLQTTL